MPYRLRAKAEYYSGLPYGAFLSVAKGGEVEVDDYTGELVQRDAPGAWEVLAHWADGTPAPEGASTTGIDVAQREEDLDELTKEELAAFAAEHDIDGVGMSMRRPAMIARIIEVETERASPQAPIVIEPEDVEPETVAIEIGYADDGAVVKAAATVADDGARTFLADGLSEEQEDALAVFETSVEGLESVTEDDGIFMLHGGDADGLAFPATLPHEETLRAWVAAITGVSTSEVDAASRDDLLALLLTEAEE